MQSTNSRIAPVKAAVKAPISSPRLERISQVAAAKRYEAKHLTALAKRVRKLQALQQSTSDALSKAFRDAIKLGVSFD